MSEYDIMNAWQAVQDISATLEGNNPAPQSYPVPVGPDPIPALASALACTVTALEAMIVELEELRTPAGV